MTSATILDSTALETGRGWGPKTLSPGPVAWNLGRELCLLFKGTQSPSPQLPGLSSLRRVTGSIC